MKLSIVIPAYNEEGYIEHCLRSAIRAADGKPYDIEFIVVNNASTDRTGEAAAAFPGVRVVDEPKKGLISARYAGFQASTGDLIANIDADTRMPDGWLDRVFSEFYADDNLVALSGPYIYYDLYPVKRVAVRAFYWVGFVQHLFNHHVLRKGAMLQGGNYVVRRSALKAIGGYNHEFDFYGEDTDIACRIQSVGRVKFTFKLPMHTSARRLNNEGIIVSGAKYAVNHLWAILFKRPFSKTYRDIRS